MIKSQTVTALLMTDLRREINDKLVEHLNEILSAENAAVDRIQTRIGESSVPEARQRLQQHLDETNAQSDRLRQLISSRGGTPTDAKADLPKIGLPPGMMAKKMVKGMAKSVSGGDNTNPLPEEKEMIRTKEDYAIESMEIITYETAIQMCQRTGASDAIPVLRQNLQEEESMANWIRTNAPVMVEQLWPKIEAAVTGVGKDRAEPRTSTTSA